VGPFFLRAGPFFLRAGLFFLRAGPFFLTKKEQPRHPSYYILEFVCLF
jgi:hypothetical protein